MKKIALFSIVLGLLVVSGCKKDLVDPTANDVEDVSSLKTFQARIKTGVTVVFFHAAWCSVCEKQRPFFESASENEESRFASFIEVEYEKKSEIFDAYNISSFPQIAFFKDGEIQEKLVGAGHTEQTIIDTAEKYK